MHNIINVANCNTGILIVGTVLCRPIAIYPDIPNGNALFYGALMIRCTLPVVLRIRDTIFSKLLYPSIRVRSAPPVSVGVRVRVSVS